MIVEREGNIAYIQQEQASLQAFLGQLQDAYESLSSDNLVINLFSFEQLSADDLLEFMELSDRHREAGRSFVLVTDQVSYDALPENLVVVPTLHEAKDIIDMDEIERDLGL